MKNRRLFALLVLVLTGCVTQPPATAAIPAPRATATPPPALPAASATPRASALPAAATPTTIPATPASTLPVLPLATPCRLAFDSVSYSPHKTWAMVTCREPQAKAGTTTRVFRMDGTQEWSVSFKQAYLAVYKADDRQATDLLEAAFVPAAWTGDETFAYLAVQSSPQDAPFAGYDALFRLDLSTGQLTPTLRPAMGSQRTSYVFQFSPGGTQLAYVNLMVQPLSIVLYNTQTGAENRIPLDARFSRAAGLVWSPDEKQLLVSAQDTGANGGNSVILFDLATMTNQYLVQNSPIVYLPLAWVGDTSVYAERYPNQWVSLDTHSKAITPAASPTPLP